MTDPISHATDRIAAVHNRETVDQDIATSLDLAAATVTMAVLAREMHHAPDRGTYDALKRAYEHVRDRYEAMVG